jgi:hypothetical protein
MMESSDPVELLECTADEQLLAQDGANLPEAVGRPEAIPPSQARGRLVGIGATLTGVTLLLGVALIALGAIEAIASGFGLFDTGALVLGLILAGTHWGWVHVAEITANSLEGRRNSEIADRRRQWLETIKPYTRSEVTTSVKDDGSISIVRVRYRPVRSSAGSFTFVREAEHEEIHSGDEPAAGVAERAELLRRQATLDTERERERFQVAADAYETALLGRGDEQEQLAARRAASQALSEQINSHLRDPPLIE